jgi:hypothetical protein
MERDERICECEDCGKRFRRGDEGDNERFCLRCCHNDRIDRMSPEERDDWYVYGDQDGEE